MNDVPELMTLRQASKYAQVSKWTLQRWERQGLAILRVNGIVRIYRADIDAFLRGHQRTTTTVVSSAHSTRAASERSR